MFGKNPNRPQDLSTAYHLRIQEIFLTIQGEGPLVGMPAVFIRLAGCNLACHFCDTEFESGMENIMSIPQILDKVRDLIQTTKVSLVVLTGGEPFRQPLRPLIDGLLDRRVKHVQIETAGTLWQTAMEECDFEGGKVSIVCSPKTPKVHPMILDSCTHWKYIIRAGEVRPSDGLPAMSTQREGDAMLIFRPPKDRMKHDTIWVQACDEVGTVGHDGKSAEGRTADNQKACVEVATRFGYRVSYQIHKALNLP